MRHVHYDEQAGGRVPGYTALSAYLRLVAGVLGAVALTTIFWLGWANAALKAQILRNGIPPADVEGLLGSLWGVELTGNVLVDSLLFAVSRLTSPFVLGTLAVAGIVTVVVSRSRAAPPN